MNKFNVVFLLLFIISGANLAGEPAAADTAVVNYPEGYRSWSHVKSMIIKPGHPLEDPFGGIHHIYANTKAMQGLNSGEYEQGAVFVFDLLNYHEEGKVIVEMERTRLDVMQYDSAKFSDTGNWGYDTFVGDSTEQRMEQDVVSACYTCHIAAEKSGFVYSKYRR
jgi:hypothetical protein